MSPDDVLERSRRSSRLPSLSAAVAGTDGLTWSGTSGPAARRGRVAASDTSLFRIGSVSKALTSAALGVAIEEGAIDLDAAIQVHVPTFPAKPEGAITARQLATHRSGLPHYRRGDFVNRTHYGTLTDALGKFADRPLLFPPGDRFSYSSFGWNLLGAALESALGGSFLDVMHDRVFAPLGLSAVGERGEVIDRARPFGRIGPFRIPTPTIDQSDAFPSGGFLATASDLARFGAAFLGTALLRRETIDLLWEGTAPGSDNAGYGMGWHAIEVGGHSAVGHGGSHVGATAQLWVLGDEGIAMAAITNTNAPAGTLTDLGGQLLRTVLRP